MLRLGYIVVILSLAATILSQTLSPDDVKVVSKVAADCKLKYPDITQEQVDKILVKRVPFTDRTEGCFAACILKKLGIVTPTNTLEMGIVDKRIKKTTPDHKLLEDKMKIVKYCSENQGAEADECVAVNKLLSCLYEQKDRRNVTEYIW